MWALSTAAWATNPSGRSSLFLAKIRCEFTVTPFAFSREERTFPNAPRACATEASKRLVSIWAIGCPFFTGELKSTKIFRIVPETWLPTWTVVTALRLPVAEMDCGISPFSTRAVLNRGAFLSCDREKKAHHARQACSPCPPPAPPPPAPGRRQAALRRGRLLSARPRPGARSLRAPGARCGHRGGGFPECFGCGVP